MKAILQRVTDATLYINGSIHSSIGKGILCLLGISKEDPGELSDKLSSKIARLRIFEDDGGKMNLSLQDIHGEILIVSQFTLYADSKKGNRPSFTGAADPGKAIPLYEAFIKQMEHHLPGRVKTGIFGADMKITFTNDGPVTIILDTDDWN